MNDSPRKHQEFAERLKASIDEWTAKIDEAEAKMKQKSAEARDNYAAEVAKMKQRRDEARDQLQRMRDSTEQEWRAFSQKAEAAFEEISAGFSRAFDRFTSK